MKILRTLLLCTTIMGCGFNINMSSLPTFTHLLDIDDFVCNNIEYLADSSIMGEMQDPEVTLRKRTGDCEDYAVLFLYLAYKSGFGKGQLIVSMYGYDIYRSHAWARVGDYEFNRIMGNTDYFVFDYDVVIGASILL